MHRPAVAIALLTGLALVAFAAEGKKKRYIEMDYGPMLGTSMRMSPNGNIAYRGYLIRIGDEQQATVCFDADTMRMAAMWSDGFINWHGVVFAGKHGGAPSPTGRPWFATLAAPGWAKDGKFDDPRLDHEKNPYPPTGNLPNDWAHFDGYYMHGDRVVLKYRVGKAQVFESPWYEAHDGAGGFITRGFEVQPNGAATTLLLAEVEKDVIVTLDGGVVKVGKLRGEEAIRESVAGDLTLELDEDGQPREVVKEPKKPDVAVKLIAVAGLPDGANLEVQPVVHKATAKGNARTLFDGQRIVLHLPGKARSLRFKVLHWADDLAKYDAADEAIRAAAADVDLSSMTRGGPRRWPNTVTTKGKLGNDDHAYTVDHVTVPRNNPYDSWMRIGGADFFADGTTAAVSTWSGDVWIVKGVDDDLDKLEWSRFATGLHQPLGLKIVDEKVYVVGHDMITRLHDLNGDGEADFYENFNSDWRVTSAFHAFAFDLHTGPDGSFYFALGAPVRGGGRSFERITPHHGKVLKVSPDGSEMSIFASGFRAPNGIGVNPKTGQVTTGDNQGTYVPNCPINWCTPGSWHGVVDTATPEWAAKLESKSSQKGGKSVPAEAPKPLAWLPMDTDNSGGGQAWCLDDRWGPMKDRLLHGSYGKAQFYLVDYEWVDEQIQGGAIHFPGLRFASSCMRLRFNDRDGQLYIAGLKGWQTRAGGPGGFDRVRYTGKPLNMPLRFRVTDKAIRITFSDALEPASATNADNWSNETYNTRWTSAYGSKTHDKREPRIAAALLSDDGKTVTLVIPEIKPVTHSMVRWKNVKTVTGDKVESAIDHTIHVLPPERDAVVLQTVEDDRLLRATPEAMDESPKKDDPLKLPDVDEKVEPDKPKDELEQDISQALDEAG